MSIYAEYAHGLMDEYEFRQAVRDEEWLDNVRGATSCDEDEECCESCVFCTWDAINEVFFCANENSEWLNEEVDSDMWCKEWMQE